MQHDVIKTFACKRQRHTVTLDEVQVKITYAGFCPRQHGGGKIEAGINVPGWKMGNIQPGADAADKDILVPLPRQLTETFSAQPGTRGREQRIVKRGNKCVGTAQGHKR